MSCFFLLSFGGSGGEKGRVFSFFLCSNKFPIAPCFNPICFAQSPPLLTYIAGPKVEELHLSIEFSIFGRLRSFNFFLPWANQIKQKNVGLMRGKGQAKNGDELFWEEKFHATKGKAQTHTEGALHFFLLSLGGGGFRGG